MLGKYPKQIKQMKNKNKCFSSITNNFNRQRLLVKQPNHSFLRKSTHLLPATLQKRDSNEDAFQEIVHFYEQLFLESPQCDCFVAIK